MEKTSAPGAGLLKVIGIIGLVLSGIGLLTTFVGFLAIEQGGDAPLSAGFLFWLFISTCYYTFMYLMAVIHCKNLEKSELLLTLGYVGVGFIVVETIVGVVVVGLSSVVMIPLSAVFLALYIVGASKNKKMFDSQLSQQRANSTDSQCATHNG